MSVTNADAVPVLQPDDESRRNREARFHVACYTASRARCRLQPGDYGVRTIFQKIPDNLLQFDGISLTVWGVPSDPSHDLMRGLACGTRAWLYCEYNKCDGNPT